MELPSLRFIFCVLVTSFLAVFPGYEFAVINVPRNVFLRFINETFQERYSRNLSSSELTAVFAFTVTSYNMGTIFGSLSTVFFAEKWGRRLSMMVLNNIVVLVGGILISLAQLANSYEMLVIGKTASKTIHSL